MKNVFLALAIMVLTIVPLQTKAETELPSLYAITFYADWCGSCKVLDPEVTKARGKADLDNQNVLFVKLDLTDATKRHQAALMASALGIGEFYNANKGKTGFVLLVDPATGQSVGTLTKELKATQISEAILEKVAAN